ncbi:class I SAM-dependent methyltransferase [Hymenobacter ruricola]|uniref:class I SAM-dependent methyltransferase n=1 Tax=Hymenobacter ruricola TaxID=2791023 RepID=UPI003743F71C
MRKPLQGVGNIVRFNWHFYALAAAAALGLGAVWLAGPPVVRDWAPWLLAALLVPVVVSLAVSAYVYDFSGLYRLAWLPAAKAACPNILTVNAGFDEISAAIEQKYAPCDVQAVDFYDPARHTEVSIRRARRAYAPFPGTRAVDSRAALPWPDNSIDLAFAFLAAHEIRDPAERADFFRELRRVIKPDGQIIVTEHLRDAANFLAYTVGFLHFHSRRAWLRTFRSAGLAVAQEVAATPFITTFILRKNAGAA